MTARWKYATGLLAGMLLTGGLLAPPPAEAATDFISVTVQDGTAGGTVAGATVTAYLDNQTCPAPPCAADWVPAAVASATSDGDGVATITIEQATLVTLRVTAPGYTPGWVGDNSSATTYFDANAYTAPSSPIKAMFQKRRNFAVTVLDEATDIGVSGAAVGLYLVDDGEGADPLATAFVDGDEDADFQLKDPALSGGVPYGTYKIRASAAGHSAQWLSATTNDWAGATVIDLSDGVSPGNQLIYLTTDPPVSGSVPTISGTAQVGRALTANPGTWTPAVPTTTLAYQWLRGATVVGTGASYAVKAADLGKRLQVKVTGSAIGYQSATRSSALSAAVVAGRFTTAPVPTISGKTRKGKVLTANPGSWVPAPATLTYRWLRGTKAIKGATGRKYKLTAKDVGKRISVRVTGVKAGYVSVTVASAKTKVIRG